MKVMIVGSGAREDALAWRFSIDPDVGEVATVPGNLGSLRWGKNIPADPRAAAAYFKPDLIVIGPENLLADGLADDLRADGYFVFGPGASGARIESSKIYAKSLMKQKSIPTARCDVVENFDAGVGVLSSWPSFPVVPVVIKADGLAQGKGVVVARSREEAIQALSNIFVDQKFGAAGHRALIEEFLEGREATVMAMTDGHSLHLLPTAEDYKQVFDGDRGPNTGGMGAVSPTPVVTPEILEKVRRKILEPFIEAIAEDNATFRGIIYAGIMVGASGPSVIEFNARFGDPEAQAILPRIEGNFAAACLSVARGKMDVSGLSESKQPTTCVVAASQGYPGPYETGVQIDGTLIKRWETEHALAFLSGVERGDVGVVTAGGRVASVVGFGENAEESRKSAYDAIGKLSFNGMHYRTDIGQRAAWGVGRVGCRTLTS